MRLNDAQAVHSFAMTALIACIGQGAMVHVSLEAAVYSCAGVAALLLVAAMTPAGGARFRFASLMALGCAGLLYSGSELYTIKRSPDSTISGQIERTRMSSLGRRRHREFKLQVNGRETRWLEWLPYKPIPADGETVAVTVHDWDPGDVVSLEVLTGPEEGYSWHSQESPGMVVICILPSLVFLGAGAWGWMKQNRPG